MANSGNVSRYGHVGRESKLIWGRVGPPGGPPSPGLYITARLEPAWQQNPTSMHAKWRSGRDPRTAHRLEEEEVEAERAAAAPGQIIRAAGGLGKKHTWSKWKLNIFFAAAAAFVVVIVVVVLVWWLWWWTDGILKLVMYLTTWCFI